MHDPKRNFLYLSMIFIHNCLGLLNTAQWWFRWQKMAPDWLWGGLVHLNIATLYSHERKRVTYWLNQWLTTVFVEQPLPSTGSAEHIKWIFSNLIIHTRDGFICVFTPCSPCPQKAYFKTCIRHKICRASLCLSNH